MKRISSIAKYRQTTSDCSDSVGVPFNYVLRFVGIQE